ncbi:MAG: hypothetical protein K8R49_05460 [Candidatus Cloacimonetes bacterium]|nr:hypothetical protein [Candidatus Cloacimonadota bacterium]
MRPKHKQLIPLFIIGGIGLVFLLGWVVQLLWNATVSEIFDVKTITYWQALMIIILCKILFGSHYNVQKHTRPRFVEHHLFKKEKPPEAEEKDEE